jgi:autotransporter-associated beta strand protein
VAPTATVTINGAGRFDLNTFTQQIATIVFNNDGGELSMESPSVLTNTGTLTLTGANSVIGLTTVSNGTLKYGRQTSLFNNLTVNWIPANSNVQSGGTLAFNVGGTNEFTTGSVTTLLTNLAASSSPTNGMNAGSRFGFDTTNAAGGTFTIADVIADSTGANGGARGLTKLGTNTLVLTNTNTYTGPTAINGGTLVITGATQATSAITFSGGGVLGLDIATPVTAAGATIDFTGQSVLVSGTPTLPSYTLLTASSLPGTAPSLASPAPSGYELQQVSNELRLVQIGGSPYATWSGGLAADIDTNNDGVLNGVAWVIGAADPNAIATTQVPTLDNTSDPDFFIFNYRRSDTAFADGNTAIEVEYGSDLTGWTDAIAGPDIIITPSDDFYAAGIDKVEVKIRRTLAVGGKLFARLNVVVTP